jgi:hypothetical protein
VIGVVLSGMLDDGTAGLQAVRRCGGLAVVQDLADAAYEDMPRSALAHVAVDHVRPAAGLAELLAQLVATPRPPPVEAPENVRIEAMIAAQELHTMPDQGRFGPPSALTCPDCSGALVEIREGGLVRYRCHTGHAFTMEALQVSQGEVGEKVLYGACAPSTSRPSSPATSPPSTASAARGGRPTSSSGGRRATRTAPRRSGSCWRWGPRARTARPEQRRRRPGQASIPARFDPAEGWPRRDGPARTPAGPGGPRVRTG